MQYNAEGFTTFSSSAEATGLRSRIDQASEHEYDLSTACHVSVSLTSVLWIYSLRLGIMHHNSKD